MRIVVATSSGGLGDRISPVFGRSQTYTVVECEGNEIKNSTVENNPCFSAAGGAGIQAAQYVSGFNAEAVIAGNFGPNADTVLNRASIKMVRAQGNVSDVVARYLRGELQPLNGPTVRDHFGMGGGVAGRGGYGGGQVRGGGRDIGRRGGGRE